METAGKTGKPISIQIRRLRSAANGEHYELHLAGLEWSLDTPITLKSVDDAKSKPNWKIDPYAHQVQNLLTFCRRSPVALFADDVGLGKTISAGLVLSELMAVGKVRRCLVICPSLLLQQWKEELDSKFGIRSEHGTGQALKSLLPSSTPVVITTYQSARNYLAEIKELQFNMVILDEAHKLRNLCGNQNPPLLAVRIHAALKASIFRYVLMLTATPVMGSLWDIYSLIDLLATAKGLPNPLGDESQFRARYIGGTGPRATQLNAGTRDEFRRHLANYIVRTQRSDSNLQFPSREVKMLRATAGPLEIDLMKLTGDIVGAHGLNGLVQTSIAQAAMSSPEAFLAQLKSMAKNGSISQEQVSRAETLLKPGFQSAKLKRLSVFIDALRSKPTDWRLIVFTTRKETQSAIADYLEAQKIGYGKIIGGAARQNQKTVEAFRADPPQIHVVVSTDSGAEGVNLQAGNVLINYDLPWNPMVVEQRIGRIQRLGTKHGSVQVLNLVVAGSIEERIVARLSEKLQAVSACLGDIESILESAQLDGEDQHDGFESLIRDMVVRSFRGQDVESAMLKATVSIEEGKRIFEAEKETVERTIGTMDAMHRTGPRVPDIQPFTPSVTPEDFVRRAMLAGGATIQKLDDEILVMRSSGRPPERFTFNEAAALRGIREDQPIFSTNAPRLYKPGAPAFERLAQTWADGNAAMISDLTASPPTERALSEAVTQLLACIGGCELIRVDLDELRPVFQGELVSRVAAAVSHDRIEKLVISRIVPTDGEIEENIDLRNAPLIRGELAVDEWVPTAQKLIRNTVDADPDLSAFAKFYDERLAEELGMTQGRQDAKEQIKQKLTTSLSAQPVAIRGIRFFRARLTVEYKIDGQGGYFTTVPYPLPKTEQLQRTWQMCTATLRRVPPECLRTCVFTSRVALRHLLTQSDRSGRFAMPEYGRVCEASGASLLQDELGKSDISGKTVDFQLLVKSELSPLLGLAEEMVRCEFTGVWLAPNEVSQSAESAKWFRKDQAVESVLSGRTGHRDEFVQSDDPPGQLLRSEAGWSDISGRVCALDRLQESTVRPGEFALADELVTCFYSQAKLFPNEVVRSGVSGKLCDLRLAEKSSASGAYAAMAELVTCASTGSKLLPTEVRPCDYSGLIVDQRLLHKSDVSGGNYLEEYLVKSERSELRCLPVEAVQCEVSGIRLLPAETGICCVTGSRCDLRLLKISSVSGRRAKVEHVKRSAFSGTAAIEDELIACEKSGRLMLPDESSLCAVSGLRVLPSLLVKSSVSDRSALAEHVVKSDVSGKPLFKSESVTCEHSGATLTRAEAGQCEVTGKLIDTRLLAQSGVSSRRGRKELLGPCEITGSLAFPDELATCEVSGRKFHTVLGGKCVLTGRTAVRASLQKSPVSGVLYSTDSEADAAAAKQTVFKTAGVRCEWLDQEICSLDAKRCGLTGLVFDSSLLNTQGELAVLRTLLDGGPVEPPAELIDLQVLRYLTATQPLLAKLSESVQVSNPSSTRCIFIGKSSAGFLGVRVRFAGGVVRLLPTPLLLGVAGVGARSAGRWEAQR